MLWSLSINLLVYVAVSLARVPSPIERMQADVFVPANLDPAPSFRLWRAAVTVEEIVEEVQRFAKEHPDDEWIVGASYDSSLAPDGLFDARWLDEVVPDRPVALRAWDYHTMWVNSVALERAGITPETPDPVLGEIPHRDDGSVLGTLREWGAVDLVPMGEKVLVATPGLVNPFTDASELAVTARDRGRIALANGFASHGEGVRRVRGKDGEFKIGNGGPGTRTEELKASLVGIQRGRTADPHGWIHKVF